MANLRIVYDNAADRASLSASTEAGSLVVENLLTEIKSEVWRSTGTSATITLTWTSAEFVSMVALPFCSLTSGATMTVKGYTNVADVVPVFNTGEVFACPSAGFDELGWGTQGLGVNAYSFGGAAYGVVWLDDTYTVEKVTIEIADTGNPLGYLEAGRIVTGSYWSPENNCEYNVQVSLADSSKNERTESGDLFSQRGYRFKTLSADLTMLPPVDRSALWRLICNNGITRPIFFSLTPESNDSEEEQMYQVYGKLSKISTLTYQSFGWHNSDIELEEI